MTARPFPSSGIEHTELVLGYEELDHDALGEFLVAQTIDAHADAVKEGDQEAAKVALEKYARLIQHRSPELVEYLDNKQRAAMFQMILASPRPIGTLTPEQIFTEWSLLPNEHWTLEIAAAAREHIEDNHEVVDIHAVVWSDLMVGCFCVRDADQIMTAPPRESLLAVYLDSAARCPPRNPDPFGLIRTLPEDR